MLGLFKKKEPEFDFSIIGNDMHCHIIPGIDDGAKSIEDSILMAQKFKALGFKKLIATPHIMIDFYRNTPDIIHKGAEILREALLKNRIDLQIEASAEYYLDENFEAILRNKEVLSFGDGYLLFELSYINAPQNIADIVSEIQDAGFKPVLAHPERYSYYHDTIENYQKIREQDCLLQLNTISLAGYYGKPCKKIAESLIANSCIDFIGSDMHHLKHAEALESSLGNSSLQLLLSGQQLLNGSL